jgi:hypothetical protein
MLLAPPVKPFLRVPMIRYARQSSPSHDVLGRPPTAEGRTSPAERGEVVTGENGRGAQWVGP